MKGQEKTKAQLIKEVNELRKQLGKVRKEKGGFSEIKQGLEQLRRRNELILSSAGEGIYGLDKNGLTTFVNPAAARMLGWRPEDLHGKPQHAVIHHTRPDGKPYPKEECPIYAAFKDGKVHIVNNEVFWKKDGTNFPVEYTSTPIRNERGRLEGAVVTFRDTTRRKLAEEAIRRANEELERKVEIRTRELRDKQAQFVQSEKMASLGQLVAGVAHEINTPLGALISNGDLFMRSVKKVKAIFSAPDKAVEVEGHPELTRLLENIEQFNTINKTATDRIMAVVNSLRNFARLDMAELAIVDIHQGLENTLTLAHHELKNCIEIHKDYGNIPPIKCYPNKLNQVFMNLFVNASHAIHGQGEIFIKTRVRDGTIMIEFKDTGIGIADEDLGRIFDPGFTKKGFGVGTGLGLSIVYQIIEDHKGKIEVESEIGKGTVFRLILPLNLEKSVGKKSSSS